MSQTTSTQTSNPLAEALRCLEHGDPCSFLPAETKTMFAHARQSRLKRGVRGTQCKVAQEWLTFHGAHLVLDGDFGPATERAVREFQSKASITSSGEIDRDTASSLIEPQLRAIFTVSSQNDAGQVILNVADAHRSEHPREIGGDNRGPWVRLYMDGRDGREFPWCAGFISFILRQAYASIGLSMADALFPGSVSCDVLAQRAKSQGRFIHGNSVAPSGLAAPALFLTRKTPTDWTHTGIVIGFESDVFITIEGNTNHAGGRNGFEVNSLTRGYGRYDFIVITP